MDQATLNKFILQQLLYFIAGRRCCQQLAFTFRRADFNIIIECARSVGLRSQYFICEGQGCMKIFKRSCRHYLEEPKALTLYSLTVMEMSSLLAKTGFLQRCQLDASPGLIALKIPLVNFSMMTAGPPALRFKSEKHREFLKYISNHACLSDILTSIYSNRVYVFKADANVDKSLLFPIIILEDSQFKKSNLKIIAIEKENIVAIHNSERLANFLDENVGETVGIEIHQNSCVSSSTHIVFTTATYFLRSIINKSSRNLNNISHFVVNDVHLHDPYIDILLSELKKALTVNQNLRIILLSQRCDSNQFLAFFGEGAESCAKEACISSNLQISYIDDIQSRIASEKVYQGPDIYKNRPQFFRNKSFRNDQLDKCLQVYEEVGTDAAMRTLLYSINFEFSPVNYQHSFNGKTAIIIAAQLNKVDHVRLLLYMGANPCIVDNMHQSAISVATVRGHTECMQILNNYILHGYIYKNAKAEFVDYDVIIDMIYLLCAQNNFPPGNILITLPSYYHILKLNYMLLCHLIIGNLRAFSVFPLFDDMGKEYLNSLINAEADSIKIVLATGIIESLQLPVSFKYLIDTACERKSWYDGRISTTADVIEWVAKDSLLRRLLILNDKGPINAQCFRLMPKDTYEKLQDTGLPALQTMHLDKICLMVKLLSPNMIISEYLSYVIAPPPLVNIHQTVQFLKKIDILDESEEVTWLGCRLIDIPVSCQLGRTLIFGIMLQCLDPILTIVSSLCTQDPLNIPFNEDIDRLWDRFTIQIQNRIKRERIRLAADQFSDHFVFLRLFQEWQNRLITDMSSLYLTDEYEFILNGLMEQLSSTRSKILSSLRAVKLVQAQGTLSAQFVSSKSGNWPLVKAALTGGLYTSICAVDSKNGTRFLKSAYSTDISLHPNTVIRDFMQPLNVVAQGILNGSQWIVCNRQRNTIKYASVVLPLAVALFNGSTKLGFEQITEIPSSPKDGNVHFFIDEWIWMVASKPNIELVMKTRQHFFKFYQYLLMNCGDSNKWRGNSTNMETYFLLIDKLASMFANEDNSSGFQKYPDIGFKPISKIPNLYLLSINSHFIWQQQNNEKSFGLTQSNSQFVEKQYFLVYTQENSSNFYQNNDAAYIESVIGKFVRPIESPNRHVYVILYSKNPDVMLSISRVKFQKGDIIFKEYFRNVIPIIEILEACASGNLYAPNFEGRLLSSLIDKRVGNLIMDLFAFRHHWIHKK